MDKKNSAFKENIAPVLVLALICLVVTCALAGTYTATKPVIAKINKENANASRSLVLPSAIIDGKAAFTQYEGDLSVEIPEYYFAENGSGVAITSQAKSFGGLITVMTGLDSSGAITGVTVTAHADTPGLGTKAMTVDYLSQYSGVTELAAESIKANDDIDAITGATISSDGVYMAVRNALIEYKEIGGVANEQ